MLRRLSVFRERLRTDDVARHSAVMVLFSILTGLFNYLYQLSMGIMLPPEQYATLFAFISLSMIVTMFTQTFQTAASRFTSAFRAQGGLGKIRCVWARSLGQTLLFGLGLAVVLGVLTPLLSDFLNIDRGWYFVVLLLSFVALFVLSANQGILQGLQRFIPLGFCLALIALLKLGFGVLLVYLGLGVSGGLLAILIGGVAVFGVSLLFMKDVVAASREECEIRGFLSYTGVAFLGIFAFGMLTNVDVVLAKHYLSADIAGDYAALSVVGRMALYAPMGVGIAMFPKTSELFDSGGDFRRVMRRAMAYALLLGGAVIAACCLFYGFIIDFVFGGKYDFTLASLMKYGLAMLLFSLGLLLLNYLLSVRRTRVAYVLVAVMLLQVVLIGLFHSTIDQLVDMVLVSGAACVLCMLPFCAGDVRRYRS